jgi:hypothetical protein
LAPLDSLFGAQHSFYLKANWQLVFAWMPHRCVISNRIIWLRYGYMGEARWMSTGKDIVEYNWHTVEEHLIWRLKNG